MKKFTKILLAVLLIVACLPLAALAADSATITGANVTAAPGETVKVSFRITEATYATYSMSIVYDKEDLTLTGLTAGEATPNGFGFNPDNGRFNCAQESNEKFSGVLVTATFTVPSDAKVGDVYPVDITVRNVTNAEREQLAVSVKAGSVTIVCPHKNTSWTITKPSTCTEAGVESLICSDCKAVLDTRAVDALGHDWGQWITTIEPTCSDPGEEYRVCARCGEKEVRPISKTPHRWNDWIVQKESTCHEGIVNPLESELGQGYKRRSCRICGEYQYEFFELAEHTRGEAFEDLTKRVEPTQTTDGYFEMVVPCSVCGKELERHGDIIPALGLDPIPNTGDLTIALGMVAILVMAVPVLLVKKFRAVK